jgi:hypothetical protein
MSGVCRGLGQAADGGRDILMPQISCFVQRLACNQFRERGGTGDRGYASFGLESYLSDSPGGDFYRDAQDISAGRVLDFRSGVGAGNFSGVARILKVIE